MGAVGVREQDRVAASAATGVQDGEPGIALGVVAARGDGVEVAGVGPLAVLAVHVEELGDRRRGYEVVVGPLAADVVEDGLGRLMADAGDGREPARLGGLAEGVEGVHAERLADADRQRGADAEDRGEGVGHASAGRRAEGALEVAALVVAPQALDVAEGVAGGVRVGGRAGRRGSGRHRRG